MEASNLHTPSKRIHFSFHVVRADSPAGSSNAVERHVSFARITCLILVDISGYKCRIQLINFGEKKTRIGYTVDDFFLGPHRIQ